MFKLCTIDLTFDRGSFEAVLIENTCRILGVNFQEVSKSSLDIIFFIFIFWLHAFKLKRRQEISPSA
jgi:hypothetical protein